LISTVSFLNLCAFASLREIAAVEGGQKFFTLRRQGAKKACGSKDTIPFPNVSGFAPLRAIAAMKSATSYQLSTISYQLRQWQP
jgi:hypothetical protein